MKKHEKLVHSSISFILLLKYVMNSKKRPYFSIYILLYLQNHITDLHLVKTKTLLRVFTKHLDNEKQC